MMKTFNTEHGDTQNRSKVHFSVFEAEVDLKDSDGFCCRDRVWKFIPALRDDHIESLCHFIQCAIRLCHVRYIHLNINHTNLCAILYMIYLFFILSVFFIFIKLHLNSLHECSV